jgi:hypothetical protein
MLVKKNLLLICLVLGSLLLVGCGDNAGGDAPAPAPKAKAVEPGKNDPSTTPTAQEAPHGEAKQQTGMQTN